MIRPFAERSGWVFGFRSDAWWFSVFCNPTHWAVDWHANAPCCKWWLVVGPFEVNRVWTDADEYPFRHHDEDEGE